MPIPQLSSETDASGSVTHRGIYGDGDLERRKEVSWRDCWLSTLHPQSGQKCKGTPHPGAQVCCCEAPPISSCAEHTPPLSTDSSTTVRGEVPL